MGCLQHHSYNVCIMRGYKCIYVFIHICSLFLHPLTLKIFLTCFACGIWEEKEQEWKQGLACWTVTRLTHTHTQRERVYQGQRRKSSSYTVTMYSLLSTWVHEKQQCPGALSTNYNIAISVIVLITILQSCAFIIPMIMGCFLEVG